MGFFNRGSRARHSTTTHRQNRTRGLQAAINNPRTTHDGRKHAESELHHMGVRANKPTLGTRIRHFLHLPGKSHGRTRHY